MSSKAIPKAFRPKTISGLVVTIDRKNIEWLGNVLQKHTSHATLKKMMSNVPKIGAIVVKDNEKEISLFAFSAKADSKQIQVNHFRADCEEADFSLLMTVEKDTLAFKDLTPNLDSYFFQNFCNFIAGVFVYEYLMKNDSSIKTDEIQPFNLFGEPIT